MSRTRLWPTNELRKLGRPAFLKRAHGQTDERSDPVIDEVSAEGGPHRRGRVAQLVAMHLARDINPASIEWPGLVVATPESDWGRTDFLMLVRPDGDLRRKHSAELMTPRSAARERLARQLLRQAHPSEETT